MNSKTKKIFSYIGYAVLAAIVITIFVFAVAPKNFRPDIVIPAKSESGIMFTVADNSSQFSNVKDEDYNEFIDLYNNAFKQNLLTCLFDGKLGKKQTVTRQKSSYSLSFTGYKMTISYNEMQTIKENGRDFYYNNSQNPVKYNRAYIDITSKNAFDKVNIIFETEEDTKIVYYTVSTYANFAKLYEFGNKIVKGE